MSGGGCLIRQAVRQDHLSQSVYPATTTTNGRWNPLGMRHVGASLGATLNTWNGPLLYFFISISSLPLYTLQLYNIQVLLETRKWATHHPTHPHHPVPPFPAPSLSHPRPSPFPTRRWTGRPSSRCASAWSPLQ